METERLLVAVLLVAGFFWMRNRIRALEEKKRPRALYGSFLLLAPGLILGKWAFDRLPFGYRENLALELIGLAALFLLTAALFTPFRRAGRGTPENDS